MKRPVRPKIVQAEYGFGVYDTARKNWNDEGPLQNNNIRQKDLQRGFRLARDSKLGGQDEG